MQKDCGQDSTIPKDLLLDVRKRDVRENYKCYCNNRSGNKAEIPS